MKRSLIGAHVSFKKETQLLGTIEDLYKIGATSGAMYICNSRSYQKFSLNEQIIQAAHQYAREIKFDLKNIIVHAPMVGNIANTDDKSGIFNLTVQSYTEDLKHLQQAGLKLYNLHPGSAPNKQAGIKRCAEGINQIIANTKGDQTILCIETMMYKGNYIGRNFEEIAEIIQQVTDKNRIGVILDTCHVWDAGYDIRKIDDVLIEFDKVIGIKYLKGLHINDSKNDLGSNKDRHENIGKGWIGLSALRAIINHPKLIDLPKALETPYGKDDFTRWKTEINLLLDR